MPRLARRHIVTTFRWHLIAFVVLNAAIVSANIAFGTLLPALGIFLVTAFLLAIHYLVYKTATVNEQWAEERIEELNLKSYDRSHIEDLKSRYRDGNPHQSDRAD
jgi:hypothetical protein